MPAMKLQDLIDEYDRQISIMDALDVMSGTSSRLRSQGWGCDR